MDTNKLIDNALSGYVEAEPRPGLEQRVLNGVRIAQARRRRARGLTAAISIAMAAAVLLFTVVPRTRPSLTPPRIPPQVVSLTAPPTAPTQSHVAVRRHVRNSRPQPLTGEERALIALVEHYPADPQLALTDIERRPIEPLEIVPIEIEPLPGYDPK